MNLIFIYGPPASGKLTVATELEKASGYRLFHNHSTRDIVHTLYPETLEQNYQLVNQLRTAVFRYCSEKNTDLIFTLFYGGPVDDDIIREYVESLNSSKDTIMFVELFAPAKTLVSRVTNESRRKHRKLVEPDALESLLSTVTHASMPYQDVLKIDTSRHTAVASANLIMQHYDLPFMQGVR